MVTHLNARIKTVDNGYVLFAYAVCGAWCRLDRRNPDPSKVTCKRCERTKAWAGVVAQNEATQ